MMLPLLLLLPFLAAGCLHALPARRVHVIAGSALAALGLACLLALDLAVHAARGQVTRFALPWIPQAGVHFDLRADGLGVGLALLVCVVALLVVSFAHGYQRGSAEDRQRLIVWLLIFTGAMLGLVLAGDLILLVLFWELTSLASFVLVNFRDREADARLGARITLLVTGSGGLLLLAGAVLLGHIAGSYEIGHLLTERAAIQAHPLFPLVQMAFIVAALTKSAQFPFHFWLARAMAAPTPVSAFLHSAALVKAGIFLLARMQPVLGDDGLWAWSLIGAGAVSFVLGAWNALRQTDLKALLAGSTVSHLGLMVLLLGLDTPAATQAALAHLLAHAVFKAGAFMLAGTIDYATGVRDLRGLGGLARRMPASFLIACVLLPAMAGLPPFSGFITKELALAAVLNDAGLVLPWALAALLPLAAFTGALLGVAYAWRLGWGPFLGVGAPAPDVARDPSSRVLLPMAACATWTLLAGLAPGWLFEPWLNLLLVGSAVPPGMPAHLGLWHGPTPALFVSLAAIAGGSLLFFNWRPAPAGMVYTEALLALPMRHLQGLAERLLPRVWAPRIGPSLQAVAWVGLVVLLPVPVGMFAAGLPSVSPAPPLAWLLWGLAMAAALATILTRGDRLLAILLLAVVGVVLSLTFAHFSAPDLALTQILVELVGTLLMMLSLHFLPPLARPGRDARLAGRVAVSVGVGMMVTLAVVQVLSRPPDGLAPWFLEHSLSDAGGANVVNVIIVDFRGFDTLGEITVLGAAALVIAALLARVGVRVGPRTRAPVGAEYPLLLAVVARMLMPVALLISVHLFLRGHNLPGGGFIAGLVMAVGLAILQMGRGSAWLKRRLRVPGEQLIAAGLGVAVLTGLASMPLGRPFLTSGHGTLYLPLLGDLPIASASVFDLGVYLVVVGAVTVIFERIGGAIEGRRDARAAV